MAEDSAESKPTREQVVADILQLGDLLDQHAHPRTTCIVVPSPPISPEESARLKAEIARLETRIESCAYDRGNRTLRAVLGIRKDEVVDPILLRCIASVAFIVLTSGRSQPTVSLISRISGLGDWATTVSARHAIRQAIIKGNGIYFSDSDYGDGIIKPGPDLVRLLSGDNALPIVWTEATLKEEKEAWQKLKNANVLKRVSSPTESPTPSAPSSQANVPVPGNLSSPKAIFESLRQTVIGMDPVVRRFSVQMAMHLKRVAIMTSGGKNTTPAVCFLLAGPSGSGKTFLSEEFGRLSGLPFAVGNMAEVSSSSYVGTSIDELFYGFIRKGVSMLDVQNGGTLFLDEIDKKKANVTNGQHDSVGEGPQGELLRLLESSGGSRFQIGGKRSNDAARGSVRTDGMAFILAGAFSGIEEIIQDKRRSRVSLGFSGSGDNNNLPPDIREFLLNWFIPELLNRINSVIVVPSPSLPQLIQISSAPAGIIARQNQFLSSFGLQISPSPEAIKELATWALESKTFARGIRSLIMRTLVEEAIFEERKGTLEISDADVRRAIEGLRREPEGLA